MDTMTKNSDTVTIDIKDLPGVTTPEGRLIVSGIRPSEAIVEDDCRRLDVATLARRVTLLRGVQTLESNYETGVFLTTESFCLMADVGSTTEVFQVGVTSNPGDGEAKIWVRKPLDIISDHHETNAPTYFVVEDGDIVSFAGVKARVVVPGAGDPWFSNGYIRFEEI